METPRLVARYSSWASPYATRLYLAGDDSVLDQIDGRGGPETITDVSIEVANDGNLIFWRITLGGDWTLVKASGSPYFEGYPVDRRPVDGMEYLPVLLGERFEGTVGFGKNRTASAYSAVLTAEGMQIIAPVNRDRWGDRAWDITGTANPVVPESKPADATAGTELESPLAAAMRKAGLID